MHRLSHMRAAERCPHANCGCSASPQHAPFCGVSCRNAAGESLPGEADLPGACACGHAACAATENGRNVSETVISTGKP